jgi:hypothetical protein
MELVIVVFEYVNIFAFVPFGQRAATHFLIFVTVLSVRESERITCWAP